MKEPYWHAPGSRQTPVGGNRPGNFLGVSSPSRLPSVPFEPTPLAPAPLSGYVPPQQLHPSVLYAGIRWWGPVARAIPANGRGVASAGWFRAFVGVRGP